MYFKQDLVSALVIALGDSHVKEALRSVNFILEVLVSLRTSRTECQLMFLHIKLSLRVAFHEIKIIYGVILC